MGGALTRFFRQFDSTKDSQKMLTAIGMIHALGYLRYGSPERAFTARPFGWCLLFGAEAATVLPADDERLDHLRRSEISSELI